ncbi:MAG: hypothetical protein BAJALOKI2v1_190001, partial [Promethearchaeota archaeon]
MIFFDKNEEKNPYKFTFERFKIKLRKFRQYFYKNYFNFSSISKLLFSEKSSKMVLCFF